MKNSYFRRSTKKIFCRWEVQCAFLGRYPCLCFRYFGVYSRAYPDLATGDEDEGRGHRLWMACTHSVIKMEHGCCSVSFATGAWNKLSRTSAATGL